MIDALLPVLIVPTTVLLMEVAATLTHRFIMHGRLGWGWHRSHHEPREGHFEQNDLYAVGFAALSIGLMVAGHWWMPLFWVSIGVIAYGVLYFFAHDGLVHQRWPFRHVPRRGYLKRLYQAHKLHHAVEGKQGCVSFGFLYAPPVEQLRTTLRGRGRGPCESHDG